ncbi:hypothetical protein LTR15_002180 [Elasticomyces elasticus]|nr:hypothetical protein LTR15_002180 [Elasticomyces elasticus]
MDLVDLETYDGYWLSRSQYENLRFLLNFHRRSLPPQFHTEDRVKEVKLAAQAQALEVFKSADGKDDERDQSGGKKKEHLHTIKAIKKAENTVFAIHKNAYQPSVPPSDWEKSFTSTRLNLPSSEADVAEEIDRRVNHKFSIDGKSNKPGRRTEGQPVPVTMPPQAAAKPKRVKPKHESEDDDDGEEVVAAQPKKRGRPATTTTKKAAADKVKKKNDESEDDDEVEEVAVEPKKKGRKSATTTKKKAAADKVKTKKTPNSDEDDDDDEAAADEDAPEEVAEEDEEDKNASKKRSAATQATPTATSRQRVIDTYGEDDLDDIAILDNGVTLTVDNHLGGDREKRQREIVKAINKGENVPKDIHFAFDKWRGKTNNATARTGDRYTPPLDELHIKPVGVVYKPGGREVQVAQRTPELHKEYARRAALDRKKNAFEKGKTWPPTPKRAAPVDSSVAPSERSKSPAAEIVQRSTENSNGQSSRKRTRSAELEDTGPERKRRRSTEPATTSAHIEPATPRAVDTKAAVAFYATLPETLQGDVIVSKGRWQGTDAQRAALRDLFKTLKIPCAFDHKDFTVYPVLEVVPKQWPTGNATRYLNPLEKYCLALFLEEVKMSELFEPVVGYMNTGYAQKVQCTRTPLTMHRANLEALIHGLSSFQISDDYIWAAGIQSWALRQAMQVAACLDRQIIAADLTSGPRGGNQDDLFAAESTGWDYSDGYVALTNRNYDDMLGKILEMHDTDNTLGVTALYEIVKVQEQDLGRHLREMTTIRDRVEQDYFRMQKLRITLERAVKGEDRIWETFTFKLGHFLPYRIVDLHRQTKFNLEDTVSLCQHHGLPGGARQLLTFLFSALNVKNSTTGHRLADHLAKIASPELNKLRGKDGLGAEHADLGVEEIYRDTGDSVEVMLGKIKEGDTPHFRFPHYNEALPTVKAPKVDTNMLLKNADIILGKRWAVIMFRAFGLSTEELVFIEQWRCDTHASITKTPRHNLFADLWKGICNAHKYALKLAMGHFKVDAESSMPLKGFRETKHAADFCATHQSWHQDDASHTGNLRAGLYFVQKAIQNLVDDPTVLLQAITAVEHLIKDHVPDAGAPELGMSEDNARSEAIKLESISVVSDSGRSRQSGPLQSPGPLGTPRQHLQRFQKPPADTHTSQYVGRSGDRRAHEPRPPPVYVQQRLPLDRGYSVESMPPPRRREYYSREHTLQRASSLHPPPAPPRQPHRGSAYPPHYPVAPSHRYSEEVEIYEEDRRFPERPTYERGYDDPRRYTDVRSYQPDDRRSVLRDEREQPLMGGRRSMMRDDRLSVVRGEGELVRRDGRASLVPVDEAYEYARESSYPLRIEEAYPSREDERPPPSFGGY